MGCRVRERGIHIRADEPQTVTSPARDDTAQLKRDAEFVLDVDLNDTCANCHRMCVAGTSSSREHTQKMKTNLQNNLWAARHEPVVHSSQH